MRQNSNVGEKNNDDIKKNNRMAFMKQFMKSKDIIIITIMIKNTNINADIEIKQKQK